ncbi:MAG: PspA/IM30 family protein [Dehalococcoidia bacterium]|nr:PspA/IM30 family protein [Dehalococcoidia bacterium]
MAGIFDRLGTLLRANLNALLDQAEDPEKMLDQILRDMANGIREAESQVAEMIAREKLLRADMEEDQRKIDEWNRKAQFALQRGQEDLAKEAIRRKLDYAKSLELSQQQWQVQYAAAERLKAELLQLRSKYESAQRQREQLIARNRQAQAQERINRTIASISTIDPSSELARMDERIRLREAKANAMAELRSGSSMDDQFAQLEADGEVEAELAALKASLAAPQLSNPTPTQSAGALPQGDSTKS